MEQAKQEHANELGQLKETFEAKESGAASEFVNLSGNDGQRSRRLEAKIGRKGSSACKSDSVEGETLEADVGREGSSACKSDSIEGRQNRRQRERSPTLEADAGREGSSACKRGSIEGREDCKCKFRLGKEVEACQCNRPTSKEEVDAVKSSSAEMARLQEDHEKAIAALKEAHAVSIKKQTRWCCTIKSI